MSHPGGLDEDGLHSLVGLERLALYDAKLGQLPVERPELVKAWLGVDEAV